MASRNLMVLYKVMLFLPPEEAQCQQQQQKSVHALPLIVCVVIYFVSSSFCAGWSDRTDASCESWADRHG